MALNMNFRNLSVDPMTGDDAISYLHIKTQKYGGTEPTVVVPLSPNFPSIEAGTPIRYFVILSFDIDISSDENRPVIFYSNMKQVTLTQVTSSPQANQYRIFTNSNSKRTNVIELNSYNSGDILEFDLFSTGGVLTQGVMEEILSYIDSQDVGIKTNADDFYIHRDLLLGYDNIAVTANFLKTLSVGSYAFTNTCTGLPFQSWWTLFVEYKDSDTHHYILKDIYDVEYTATYYSNTTFSGWKRIIKDYGLKSSGSIKDLSLQLRNCTFTSDSTVTDTPESGHIYHVRVMYSIDAGYCLIQVKDLFNSKNWFCEYNGSTWSSWVQLLNSVDALPAVSGAALTNLNASNLSSGTIPQGRLPITVIPWVASVIITGTINAVGIADPLLPSGYTQANTLILSLKVGSLVPGWSDSYFIKSNVSQYSVTIHVGDQLYNQPYILLIARIS